MKRIFSVLILALVLTTNAYAEHEKSTYNSQKPVSCTTPEEMLKIVKDTYGEVPYFKGKGLAAAIDGKQWIQTTVIFAINMETKSFTVIEFLSKELVCIVAGGSDWEFIPDTKLKTKVSWEK